MNKGKGKAVYVTTGYIVNALYFCLSARNAIN